MSGFPDELSQGKFPLGREQGKFPGVTLLDSRKDDEKPRPKVYGVSLRHPLLSAPPLRLI